MPSPNWNLAQQKAAATARWALTMTKVRIPQVVAMALKIKGWSESL